jgi:hypothetical protein
MTDAIDYGYGEAEPECAAPAEEAREESAPNTRRIRKVLSARRLTGIHCEGEEEDILSSTHGIAPPRSRGGKKKGGKSGNKGCMSPPASDEFSLG